MKGLYSEPRMSFAIGAILMLLGIFVLGAIGWCWFLRRALRGDIQ